MLRMYRSTPHPTTGEILAEILFGRKYRTKLPDGRKDQAKGREDIERARKKDKEMKEIQKKHKDKKGNVRPHNIREGDWVLRERQTTKNKSPYDPEPYKVTKVKGTQITATRGKEIKTRDSKMFKKIKLREKKYTFRRGDRQEEEDPDIGYPREAPQQAAPPQQAAQQQAQQPAQGGHRGRDRRPIRENWITKPHQPRSQWNNVPRELRDYNTRGDSERRDPGPDDEGRVRTRKKTVRFEAGR